ncbi:hypothetical protein PsorP6_011238 [Peronosclerospora sorghi]|uniref:Uncharacterized protein n=1 Tax=Peronosclerospora sorghi TaxID=230839 RepID=A0ACC0WJM4_9STRA|nr:hypothetical protein PsorP6_011238 [Peronosclerospora sorghi]
MNLVFERQHQRCRMVRNSVGDTKNGHLEFFRDLEINYGHLEFFCDLEISYPAQRNNKTLVPPACKTRSVASSATSLTKMHTASFHSANFADCTSKRDVMNAR